MDHLILQKSITMACVACVLMLSAQHAFPAPKNVIYFVGDGMGFEHVKAAGMYANGAGGSLLFESFPHQAEVTTFSADSPITDSAAAATAIATGIKVNNGVVSTALPGDGSELYTLLEYFSDRSRSTGLVTTTSMTHATPAAFGSHDSSRNNLKAIANDYLTQTRPNVLFGGGDNGMTYDGAATAGYTVVSDRTGMAGLADTAHMVSGQFGSDNMPFEYDYFTGISSGYDILPHLSEMTRTALDILDNDVDGFFLMVEGGRIDHAAHENSLERSVFETLEFNAAVSEAFSWAEGRNDTLILVTSDHETGGLEVLGNNGPGSFPDAAWSTFGHTGINVPVYAWGDNAVLVSGVMDNTDLYHVAIVPEPASLLLFIAGGAILASRPRPARKNSL